MSLESNFAKIAESAAASGASLIAVTKGQSGEKIETLLKLGHRIYGENKVQEAQAHWEKSERRQKYPDLELHLIGALQTNKVKEAVALFDVIQTLDREKLASALADEVKKQKRSPVLFIQVNTGDEVQKGGVSVDEAESLYRISTQQYGLRVEGLMCIPPVNEDAAKHFQTLKKLRDMLGLRYLSMGMSADYEIALQHGATHIRVGTALFGDRE